MYVCEEHFYLTPSLEQLSDLEDGYKVPAVWSPGCGGPPVDLARMSIEQDIIESGTCTFRGRRSSSRTFLMISGFITSWRLTEMSSKASWALSC